MRKNVLIVVALLLAMANLLIFDTVADYELRLHRPVQCNYLYTDSDIKVCE